MNNQVKNESIKIITRFTNGKIIKGYTSDFFPNKPFFHVYKSVFESEGEGVKVHLKDLKAIFFVKDFEGNPSHDERKEFERDQILHGRKIEITFRDSEILVGTTTGYDPHREGFFLFPVDPQSNNLRVFVISAAVKKVRWITG